MNIEEIKNQTQNHYKDQGKEEFYNQRISELKNDILKDFKSFQSKYPNRSFEDFKNSIVEEMKSGFQYSEHVQYIGLSLNALDLINPTELN